LCTVLNGLPTLKNDLDNAATIFTVFAPDNDAFVRYLDLYYPSSTINELIEDSDENEALAETVKNHLIIGWTSICFDDLTCSNLMYTGNGDQTETICILEVDGPTTDDCKSSLTSDVDIADGEKYYIYQKGTGNTRSACNLPKIKSSSIGASNGVIHVVNNVITTSLPVMP